MTYKTFKKLIEEYKKIHDNLSELHSMGFDLYEGKYAISESVYNMLTLSLESSFTIEGIDWVSWFIYESEYGTKDWSTIKSLDKDEPVRKDKYGAHDEKGNAICYSTRSLYKHLSEHHTKK